MDKHATSHTVGMIDTTAFSYTEQQTTTDTDSCQPTSRIRADYNSIRVIVRA